jgi:hypothetical protein
MRRCVFYALVVAVVIAPFALVAQEQEGAPRPRRAPRVFAGCPEAPAQFDPCATEKAKAFTPPRTPEGDPNLGGYWGRTMNSYDLEAHPDSFMIRGQPTMIVDPADGKLPYQPWAAQQKGKNYASYYDTNAGCLLSGLPRTTAYMSDQMLVQQRPGYIFMVSGDHGYRIIKMDSSPHVGKGISLWNGDSRGHWEGNTLVIDSTNLNGKFWIDIAGNFGSDSMHVVERITLVDGDTIHYRATIDDPKVYTRSWTIAVPLVRNKSKEDMWLESCHEGEHDSNRLRGAGHTPYPGWARIAAAAGR